MSLYSATRTAHPTLGGYLLSYFTKLPNLFWVAGGGLFYLAYAYSLTHVPEGFIGAGGTNYSGWHLAAGLSIGLALLFVTPNMVRLVNSIYRLVYPEYEEGETHRFWRAAVYVFSLALLVVPLLLFWLT